MKAAVLDGTPYLPGLFAASIYDTNPVRFLLMCCNAIKWVHKTRQVYDLVHDAHFLRLNVNYYYNYNIN